MLYFLGIKMSITYSIKIIKLEDGWKEKINESARRRKRPESGFLACSDCEMSEPRDRALGPRPSQLGLKQHRPGVPTGHQAVEDQGGTGLALRVLQSG